MKIKIDTEFDKLTRGLNTFEKQFLPLAVNRSINRVGPAVATAVRRDVSKQAGISQKALKQRGFYSQVKSSIRTLTFAFIVKWGAIPLKDFSPTQTKAGVVAKAWGKKQTYDGAFKVDSLGGHVFVRKTGSRLPIKKLYGPIPARIAANAETTQSVNAIVRQRMPRELSKNLAFYIKRALNKG